LVGGLVAALGLVFAGRLPRRLALAAAALGLAASLAGPTAYTLSTLAEGHTGSIVTAGPSGASMMGGGPGGGMPGRNQQDGGGNAPGGTAGGPGGTGG
ncbi:glycosyl transferase, partial [Streptomyces sp. TRM76130]|nr:glycosyl transferase [Streptomyces sp. TRM76130]